MRSKVLMWVVEVEIPFHHGSTKRWEVVIVDAFGNKLVENWSFPTEMEAADQANHWQDTHPGVQVFKANLKPV